MALVDGNASDNPMLSTETADQQPVDDVEQKAHTTTTDTPDNVPLGKRAVVGDVDYEGRAIAKQDVAPEETFRYIRKTPELVSLMSALVDDIMGRGFELQYVGRQDTSGRNKLRDARMFIESTGFKEELEAALFDMMALGDGYLFKRKIDRDQLKSAVSEYIDDKAEFNNDEFKAAAEKRLEERLIDVTDEDVLSTKGIQQVPSSTMYHDINKFGDITEFVQKVNGENQHLDPDKVIRLPMIRLDGRTYSFSPMQSIIAETQILGNIKDTHGVFFSNAAVPNKIWKLESSGPGSDQYNTLLKTVRAFRKMSNKHKDLVVTGDVEVENLNMLDDAMEFRSLAEYITSVLVMAWGVPPTRVSNIIGSSASDSGARQATLSHEGYYLRIERLQDKITTILNSELFVPEFDVAVSLRSPNSRRKLREAESELKHVEVVKQKMSLGLMTREEALKDLGIREWNAPDLDDLDESDIIQLARKTTSNKQLMSPLKEAEKDEGDAGTDAERRSSATN